jgi:aryl-alcohol dehydrogenase (NADP+)
MKYRMRGRTGIEVSAYCLGVMMFGAAGNSDHDDSVRINHRVLDAGITSSTPPTCAPVANRR